MFVFATLQTFLVAFVWGSSAFRAELEFGSQIRSFRFLPLIVKYISFPYITIIIVFWFVKNLGARLHEIQEDAVTRYAFILFGVIAATLFILSIVVTTRWKRGETSARDASKSDS